MLILIFSSFVGVRRGEGGKFGMVFGQKETSTHSICTIKLVRFSPGFFFDFYVVRALNFLNDSKTK